MKYPLSRKIIKTIKRAKKILVGVHKNPDSDGAGSALSFYEYLTKLNKEVKVICPSDLTEDLEFLPYSEKIEKIDFNKFNFGEYDLFIILDSSSWGQVAGNSDFNITNTDLILIDHHKTANLPIELKVADSSVSSTAELVYNLFKEWRVKLTKTMSQNLLAGIIGDTGTFQYPNTTYETLEVAKNLMILGARKDEITDNLYKSYSFMSIKFWGEIIQKMEIEKENKFVYSAIDYETYEKYQKPFGAKSIAASMFCSVIKDVDFGMIMIEEEKNTLSISLRSKKDFNVAQIAEDLGGGGHVLAAGCSLKNMDFPKAVEKALVTARKYAQENSKGI